MLTRNFYNIGFTPAWVGMRHPEDARCSFIPLNNADKKRVRTILNTDNKRIIGGNCTVTEANEDASSKMPSYSNEIRRFPSSTMSVTVPFNRPSPKEMTAPGLAFFPGFTSVSQT